MTDRYIPGVPCWVDAASPDPEAAVDFYAGLFGWECEDTMPSDAPGHYFMARLDGSDVAAIGSLPEGAPAVAAWNTYVWVESAERATAKATAAGATVVAEPLDVFDAGRMATLADPAGATISLWEPGRHRGAGKVNEPGTVVFNDLYTTDVEGAKTFYGDVFGWGVLELGEFLAWTIPSYGDHLEKLNPGVRESLAEMGGPTGFENVVATLVPVDPDHSGQGDTSPHWGVTFGIADADKAAERAEQLGGRVLTEPVDAPWVRFTTIRDPQGATFVASQFVPPTS
jgi:predicted enzyme related to lactoylglutathione lyase